MNFTMKEIVKFVCDNGVKFIRLAFADLRGGFKSVAILPTELERAFDVGISIDGSAVDGFSDVANSDLFLRPDPATLTLLPWADDGQKELRFICDIYSEEGKPFVYDARRILKTTIERAFKLGYVVKIGAESEFYLFKTADGRPTREPLDGGGYLDMYPLDKGDALRRDICVCLEDMDMFPETSHHERGPGQNEIDFRYSDALSAADNFLSFKSVVKTLAEKNGLFASFMPKPLPTEAGNGLHINLSLEKNGENVFDISENCCGDARRFMAGILSHAVELTAVLNTTPNSYERLGAFEAPKVINWSRNNRSAYIRIPAAKGDGNRMELRVADAAVNPYFATAGVISAGIDGIEKNLPLMPECTDNAYTTQNKNYGTLPEHLSDATAIAEKSPFMIDTFGGEVLSRYLNVLTTDSVRTDREELFLRL